MDEAPETHKFPPKAGQSKPEGTLMDSVDFSLFCKGLKPEFDFYELKV